MDINEAMAHFNERFAYYKQSYEPLNPLLLPSSDESDDSNSDDRNNSIARTDSDRLDLNASEQCMKVGCADRLCGCGGPDWCVRRSLFQRKDVN